MMRVIWRKTSDLICLDFAHSVVDSYLLIKK